MPDTRNCLEADKTASNCTDWITMKQHMMNTKFFKTLTNTRITEVWSEKITKCGYTTTVTSRIEFTARLCSQAFPVVSLEAVQRHRMPRGEDSHQSHHLHDSTVLHHHSVSSQSCINATLLPISPKSHHNKYTLRNSTSTQYQHVTDRQKDRQKDHSIVFSIPLTCWYVITYSNTTQMLLDLMFRLY